MIVDLSFNDDVLRLVNVYHCVPERGHDLSHILSLELDPVVPTLVAGDFNTHGPEWSLPGASMSPWAQALEEWFEASELSLCNPHGVATWLGREDQCPSVLDLALLNTPAKLSNQFSDISVSFDLSLGLDHAALTVLWTPMHALPPLPPSTLPGFAIEDELKETWSKAFAAIPDPIISSPASLAIAADRLLSDITDTCTALFEPRKLPDPRGARWWNSTCSAALTAVQTAPREARQMASRAFSTVLAAERRKWADDFLHHTAKHKLWEATRWRHGHRTSRIPPLRTTPDADLARSHDDISATLSNRFFPLSPTPISPSQPDDLLALPTRDWPRISSDEIRDALAHTSNASAPSLSGINYKLIKWAFAAKPSRFVDLYNECLDRGLHPWTTAKVVPIAKPSKPDYSLPKAYRPISLLECSGKLLEKIVANRILHDLNTFSILPPTQFGSRDGHCAVDAALAIAHTAQQGRATKHPVALLLFDIQGFFDNIRRERLVHLLHLFGFPSHLVDWIASFLSNRNVSLHFNGEHSTLFAVLNGTPQGSPLSPIISAIYTIPLLRLADRWTPGSGSSQLYVDDGGIITAGATYGSAIQKVAMHYEEITDWLLRNGLRTDPDKCEIIVFHNPRWSARFYGHLPSRIGLRDTSHGEIHVTRSPLVRYLGIFFHETLNWEPHVKIMANRARSTIQALHILGNSIRGLDFANWRKVYHAIVLPVLTYGAPLWAHNPPKSLLNLTRVAQNDALRRIAGVFRTTPTAPLPHLLAILPIQYTLSQLVGSYSDRLNQLPPSHSLCTITIHNPAALWPPSPAPTALSRLLPMTLYRHYVSPPHPSLRTWSHPHFSLPPHPSPATNEATRALIHRVDDLRLFIITRPSADSSQGFFALFHGPSLQPTDCGWTSGTTFSDAQWSALLAGLACVSAFPNTCPLRIFLPNRAILPHITSLHKHRHLPQTVQLVGLLDDFCTESSPTEVRLFSPKWKNMPYALALASSGNVPHPSPPQPPSRRERAFLQWGMDYDNNFIPRRGAAWIAITRPQGNTPPPFTMGALSPRNRRYFSTCMQLVTRHCFDADYSLRFRPRAGDEVRCPCGFSGHLDGSAVGSGPTRGRTDTDAGSQRNVQQGPLDFDALQRQYLDPENDGDSPPPRAPLPRLPLHTMHHVLSACPLTLPLRTCFLRNMEVADLFRSELGSSRLCRFLHFSQELLRPLPPRPDPP